MIGKTIAHYRLLEKLGEGGMGTVYSAEDTRLRRRVALKVLSAERASDPQRLARFEREATAVAALSHPNIVTLFSVEEAEGLHFITMELVKGKSLDQLIPPEGMRLAEFFRISIPLADALVGAHEKGIIHRDLKPTNVLVQSDGRPKVLDFGLAKLVEADPTMGGASSHDPTLVTKEGLILGTVAYMSPEQAEGKPLDHRTDIFSLGILFYEMVTGRRPFQGKSSTAVLSSILKDVPPPAAALREDLPPHLGRIIRRMLQRDPERRYQAAGDVRIELEDLQRELDSDDRFAPEFREPQPAARRGTIPGGPGRQHAIVDRTFRLSAEICRQLSRETLDPRMIGDDLHYLDNQVDSEVLICFLHGLGLDGFDFEPILATLPCRGVAPTLYGSETQARRRARLSLEDHSKILNKFLSETLDRERPKFAILVGFSLGADLGFQLLSSAGRDLHVDGYLSLDCNINRATCSFSELFARIPTEDTEQLLEGLRTAAGWARTLDDWISTHEYLVKIMRKFHGDIGALKHYAQDVVRVLQETEEPFVERFRTVSSSVARLRCVFSNIHLYNQEVEALLLRQLDSGILGEHFDEDSIVTEHGAGHFDLIRPERLRPHLEFMVNDVRRRAR
jgi:serine/threonine protein kinase